MDERTYRPCVRVIVTKGDLILVCKRQRPGKPAFYTFPGGGVESNQSKEDTVVTECLEEVGVLVREVQDLGVSHQYEANFTKGDRAKYFKGNEDFWFTAKYARVDTKMLGADNDEMTYSWEKIEAARRMVCSLGDPKFNPITIKALSQVQTLVITPGSRLATW